MNPNEHSTSNEGPDEEVRAYVYRSPEGEPSYRIVRSPFQATQHYLNGVWLSGLGGMKKVPYRCPELLAAIDGAREIWITEGEKDVETAVSLGLTATCTPFGASGFSIGYAPFFEGVTAARIIADKDAPGLGYARDAERCLREAGVADIRVFQARAGKDLTDHVAAGLRIDDLVPIDLGVSELAAERAPSLFRAYTYADLLSEPHEMDWLVEDLLVRDTYGQIAGEQKVFKTYLALHLALAIASARPFFDRFAVPQPGPVLIFSGEGGRADLARRVEAIAGRMGLGSATPEVEFRFGTAAAESAVFRDQLQRDLEHVRPVLTIIDPWYAFHGSTTQATNLFHEGALLHGLSDLCAHAGSSLLLTHHFNQTGSGRSLKRTALAGSAEWCDSWLLLFHSKPPDPMRGSYELELAVGSRQWGGGRYGLKIQRHGDRDGGIDWQLESLADGPHRDASTSIAEQILTIVEQHPYVFSKQGLYDEVRGNRANFEEGLQLLLDTDGVHGAPTPRLEGGRMRTRILYAVGPAPETR